MRWRYLILLLLLAEPAFAVPASAAVASLPGETASLTELLLALAVVITLIFVTAWLIRRLQGSSVLAMRGMKVLASLSLSPRERLVLVQVGDEQLLLGVAPGQVSLIEKVDPPLPLDTAPGRFRERLAEALKGQGRS